MALLYAFMPCTTAITSRGVLRMIYLSGSSSGSRARLHPWVGEDLCKRGALQVRGKRQPNWGTARKRRLT